MTKTTAHTTATYSCRTCHAHLDLPFHGTHTRMNCECCNRTTLARCIRQPVRDVRATFARRLVLATARLVGGDR